MLKTGHVVLPLHGGHAPAWLIKRMKALADEMTRLMVLEHGTAGFLRYVSDPYWFQAFGCVLGFDWHSSGLTTVVSGVLRNVVTPEKHGLAVVGGKGKASRNALNEIEEAGSRMGLSTARIETMKYASRMCAKVDNSAIQAGYPIYHHSFIVSEEGKWAVVQQGLNVEHRKARRYHWLSENTNDFVVEPHNAVVGDEVRRDVLNMTAREAEENRDTCVDLVKQNPGNLVSSIRALSSRPTLDRWTNPIKVPEYRAYEMPWDLDWQVFFRLYDVQPRNYEELLAFRGVGPATVRALALVSQLVYGKPISWRDPVKFSFAHGGKDGVPFPVNREAMDGTVKSLREMLEGSELDRGVRLGALNRLGTLSRSWGF